MKDYMEVIIAVTFFMFVLSGLGFLLYTDTQDKKELILKCMETNPINNCVGIMK